MNYQDKNTIVKNLVESNQAHKNRLRACPFCDGKNSLGFKSNGVYHCFTCHEKGNYLNQSGKAIKIKKTEYIWQRAKTIKNHPYLNAKGFKDINGFKEDKYGNLLVPAFNLAGEIMTLQMIKPELKKKKLFLKNDNGEHPKKSHFYPIAGNGDRILFAEGIATALSINHATDGKTISCYDAGNIYHVIEIFRKEYPNKPFVICADNDYFRTDGNIGIEIAINAARDFNCLIAIPEFILLDDEKKPTDFNDLHIEQGIDAVKYFIKKTYTPDQAQKVLNRLDKSKSFNALETFQDYEIAISDTVKDCSKSELQKSPAIIKELTVIAHEMQVNDKIDNAECGILLGKITKRTGGSKTNFLLGKKDQKKLKKQKAEENFKKLPDSFWYEVESLTSFSLKIERTKVYDLLSKKGVCIYHDTKNNELHLVRIKNNICKEIKLADIQNYMGSYIKSLPNKVSPNCNKWQLLETFSTGINNYVNESLNHTLLKRRQIDFLRDTPDTTYHFFKTNFIEITAKKAVIHDYKDMPGVIWESKIIDHEFSINDFKESNFYNFTKCVCTDPKTGVFEKDRHEALQQAIGYLLSNYSAGYVNKVVILSEASLTTAPQGRTGKGILANAVRRIKKMVDLNGYNFDFAKNFAFQRITQDTEIVWFDEANFELKKIFSPVSEGYTYEKKKKDQQKFSKKYNPKTLLTTNYDIKGNSESDKARRIDVELLCYFSSSHTPQDKYKEIFFDGWNTEQWNEFYNFMMSCCQKWLKSDGAIQNYSNEILKLKSVLHATSPDFLEFMDDIKIGTDYDRTFLYQAFISEYGIESKFFSQRKFKEGLELYAYAKNYDVIMKRFVLPDSTKKSSNIRYELKTAPSENKKVVPIAEKTAPSENKKVVPIAEKTAPPEKCSRCKYLWEGFNTCKNPEFKMKKNRNCIDLAVSCVVNA